MLRLPVCLSLVLLAPALPAHDLYSLFNKAVLADPQLKAARAQYHAVAETKNQARSGLLPQVSASASSSANKQTSSGTKYNYRSDSLSLNLTQPIFNYASFVKLKQAKATVKKANAELNAAYLELMVRVSERYFSVLTSVDRLVYAESERTAIARQLEQASKRFEVGLTAITNVHEAKAARDLAEAQVITAENELANSREALHEIINEDAAQLHRLKENIPMISPEPANMEQWTATALKQNLTLQAAEHEVAVAKSEITIRKSGHLPTVDLVASQDQTETDGGSFGPRDTETGSVELRLTVPLYSGGNTQSRTREANHLYARARENHEKQRRSTVRQARDAYRGVVAGISRVRALKQAIVSTESAVQATQAGFRVGTRTIVDVLVSQRELYKAKSDYSTARHEYVVNLLRLKLAAGTLSVSDLQVVNGWLSSESSH